MQASRVTVSLETRAKMANPVLDNNKRRKLRMQLVKEAIIGRKSGKFSKQELIAVAGYDPTPGQSDYWKGAALLRTMLNRRAISHDKTGRRIKVWKVTNAPKPVVQEPLAETVMPKEIVVALQDYKQVEKVALLDMAKEFAWKENSDSLREFIAYVENAIK